jgi:hypothetical protein
MARYYIETAHFLDKIWYPAGATIDWDGPPSEHMIPIEEWQARREKRAAVRTAARSSAIRTRARPRLPATRLPAKGRDGWTRGAGGCRCLPNDERNPDFVPPNLSKPITPGADEAAQSAPAKQRTKRKPRAASKPTSKAKK